MPLRTAPIFIALTLTAVGLLGFSQLARADITTGLVGHWTFDNTTQDASGQGNHGTAQGGPVFVAGKIGQALEFDGTDDYVQTTSNELKTASALTMAAWIRADDIMMRHIIWQGAAAGNGGGAEEELALNLGNTTSGASNQLQFFAEGVNDDVNITTPFSDTANWRHVAAGVTGLDTTPQAQLFLDGVSIGTDTADAITRSLWDTDLRIGRPGVADRLFNGAIDEVRVYTRALSLTDIQELYAWSGAPDTEAPSVPGNPSATSISQSQINLSWTASTDNVGVANYRIRRCQDTSCTPSTVITTIGNTTSYSDTGLSANTVYRYTISALDGAGNESGQSSIVGATTLAPDTEAPTAPTNLTATAQSSSQINLSWTASTDNVGVTNYELYRCTGSSCTPSTLIASPAGTTFSNTGLTAETTYSYRVRAVDAVGNTSGDSTTVSATTPTTPNITNMFLQGKPPHAGSTFDGATVPLNIQGQQYPTPYLAEGNFTNALDATDAVSGKSLRMTLTSGDLYAQFNPYTGTARGFAREYSAEPGNWQFDTYNRLRFWIKLPPTAPPHRTNGSNNMYWGAYVKRVTNANSQSDEEGGGHPYFDTNIPNTNTWVQIILSPHPSHWRGHPGAQEEGFDMYPTGEDGQYNFWDALTRFYMSGENSPPSSYPADYLLDDFEFYYEPYQENDDQIYSIVGTFVPTTNRFILTWSRHKDENSINHEVRYAFQNIHEIGWNAATPAPSGIIAPLGWQGYNKMLYDSSQIDASSQPTVYFAIKPQNSNLFSQIAIPTGHAASPDTTSPSPPTNVSATAQSSSQINLSWSASTDNVGVTGYRLERCQGSSCSNFTQITAPSGTSYSDTGLTANTTYRYRVRAVDGAGNLSNYSSIASATTQSSAPLVGDLNADGTVNALDWGIMNAAWFTSDPTSDINTDGLVNSLDFGLMNANWS